MKYLVLMLMMFFSFQAVAKLSCVNTSIKLVCPKGYADGCETGMSGWHECLPLPQDDNKSCTGPGKRIPPKVNK